MLKTQSQFSEITEGTRTESLLSTEEDVKAAALQRMEAYNRKALAEGDS